VKRAIRTYSRDAAAIVVLVVVAIVVGVYVLHQERLRFPFFESQPFTLKAEFSTAQAVTPGQGQTVRVSGVRIGDISGVSLHGDRAVVSMAVDPQFKGLIHTDATALLRPKTGLKDMFVEVVPGSRRAPAAPAGFTIPLANTLPDVNPDEILASLDQDTRDYLQLLVQGAGQGLRGGGPTLQDVFARFAPTHRDLARVTTLVSRRHQNLAHLVHSLSLLDQELATRGPEIRTLVGAASQTFGAIASEQANLGTAVAELPGALRNTTVALGKVKTFADILHPTAVALGPVALSLTAANRALTPFLRETTPIVANQIRPFVRSARPVVRQLTPAAAALAAAAPDLTGSFTVLNHLFNMLAYNPYGGSQYDASKDGSYLFWLAWLGHNGDAVFSSSDANGPFRAITQTTTCTTLKALVTQQPLLPFLGNLAGVLSNPALCGS
jgi:phospholipid/cholesterol/gamma-HCH transport system substrate-binding protein